MEGQPEIEQFWLKIGADENVGRLQVAMQNMMLMQDFDSEDDFAHQFNALADGEGARGVKQVRAFDIFHDKVRPFLGTAEAEDRDDIRIADLSERSRFLHEARTDAGVIRESCVQGLDGDSAI